MGKDQAGGQEEMKATSRDTAKGKKERCREESSANVQWR